jgi:hypothetical protein
MAVGYEFPIQSPLLSDFPLNRVPSERLKVKHVFDLLVAAESCYVFGRIVRMADWTDLDGCLR